MNALNFKYPLLLAYLLINLIVFTSANNNVKPHCENVRNLFTNEGLYLNNNKPDSGNLRICRPYKSCCTKSIEFTLNVKSKSDFQQKFRQLINKSMESSLNSWGESFNKYYLDVINLGQNEFDLMFRKLYGSRYEENYDIFNELFKTFQVYHEKGEIDLELALNSFFEKLFVRLFKMLNPNFQFQPDYIKCLTENMKAVEPFGEVPKDLMMNLKRQLGASRTFVQGLFAGSNIINQLNQIDNSGVCGVELMQINYCSLCAGHINLKPCKPNCEWAYSKCIVNYQDFEAEWNKYLDTILQFGKRLENQLSLENTLGSLNYKISDIVMLFQENKVSITDKVFEKCSKIKNVNKRSVKETDDGVDLSNTGKFKEMKSKNEEIGKTWKNLAKEVQRKIRKLKSYWSKLPKAVCKNLNPTNKCWNGTNSIDLNKQIKPSFDLRIQKNSKIYQLIDLQKNKLKIVNNKLISSYNGNGLEKFDFDTQASFSIGITTELDQPIDDPDDEDEEEDEDYDTKNKNREFNQRTIQDEPIEPNEQLSQNDQEKDESNLKDVRNQPDGNNLENNVNNVYPVEPQTSNIDKPKDLSLTNNSISTSISLSTLSILIISQIIFLIRSYSF